MFGHLKLYRQKRRLRRIGIPVLSAPRSTPVTVRTDSSGEIVDFRDLIDRGISDAEVDEWEAASLALPPVVGFEAFVKPLPPLSEEL